MTQPYTDIELEQTLREHKFENHPTIVNFDLTIRFMEHELAALRSGKWDGTDFNIYLIQENAKISSKLQHLTTPPIMAQTL